MVHGIAPTVATPAQLHLGVLTKLTLELPVCKEIRMDATEIMFWKCILKLVMEMCVAKLVAEIGTAPVVVSSLPVKVRPGATQKAPLTNVGISKIGSSVVADSLLRTMPTLVMEMCAGQHSEGRQIGIVLVFMDAK
jgi:hypothetical protein